jgi:hypothetical protein
MDVAGSNLVQEIGYIDKFFVVLLNTIRKLPG